jgi:hypothetical protein
MANEEHFKILRQGVQAWNKWRHENYSIDPDLSEANLSEAKLRGADLSMADLRGADLTEADLFGARLTGADLRGADLTKADLSEANLSEAAVGGTVFGDVDLSPVKGLETVRHSYPSTIGVDTIYSSKGKIPEVFLRGCGVPDEFITYVRSLVAKPIKFYRCFISHSSKNQDFVEQLHADLDNKGVRNWYAKEDLRLGAKIRPSLDESIRQHEKLLVVLSQESIASDWVEQEIETALAIEREERRPVVLPITIDNAVMQTSTGWPAFIKYTRNIGDFTNWKDHDAYQRAFARLLQDLKAESAEA